MTTPEVPSISVVLPSYRREEQLLPLARRYLDEGADQLVVVLDGPHPGVADRLEAFGDPRLDVVELPENGGLALARIAGLRVARCDVVLLADDDVIPAPGTLAGHRRLHARGAADVVLGYMPVRQAARGARDQAASRLYARDYEAQTRCWEVAPDRILPGLWNGSASLRRDLYEAAEEAMPSVPLDYHEDLDLGLRLARLGATAVFDRRLRAEHVHRHSWEQFTQESARRGRADHVLLRRWGSLPPEISGLVRLDAVPAPARPVVRWVCGVHEHPWRARAIDAVYHALGALRMFGAQDLLARCVRRGYARAAFAAAVRAETATSPVLPRQRAGATAPVAQSE